MDNEKHNGWHNYATWRVKLEFFYDVNYDGEKFGDKFDLAAYLEEQIDNFIDENTDNSFVAGWALSFIEDVDFVEIAESLIEDYPELIEKEETN